MDDAEPEFASVCRAVHDLLLAEERLIRALRAQGMLDSRAGGVLAAVEALTADADRARLHAADADQARLRAADGDRARPDNPGGR